VPPSGCTWSSPPCRPASESSRANWASPGASDRGEGDRARQGSPGRSRPWRRDCPGAGRLHDRNVAEAQARLRCRRGLKAVVGASDRQRVLLSDSSRPPHGREREIVAAPVDERHSTSAGRRSRWSRKQRRDRRLRRCPLQQTQHFRGPDFRRPRGSLRRSEQLAGVFTARAEIALHSAEHAL
jgi:hypothetical protein